MLAVRSARLWPGPGATTVSPAMVVVEDGRILDVDGAGSDPPPDADFVDLGDVTVMPGLVDAHVHLCFDASRDVLGPLLRDDDATVLDRMQRNATDTLQAGVTTVPRLG